MLIRVDAFYLRKPGENSTCPVLNLRVPPRVGANRRLYNRVLISKDDSNIYLIRFTFEKDEDRGSAFCVVL